MECPGTEAARQEIFGSMSLPLSILTLEEPGKEVLVPAALAWGRRAVQSENGYVADMCNKVPYC